VQPPLRSIRWERLDPVFCTKRQLYLGALILLSFGRLGPQEPLSKAPVFFSQVSRSLGSELWVIGFEFGTIACRFGLVIPPLSNVNRHPQSVMGIDVKQFGRAQFEATMVSLPSKPFRESWCSPRLHGAGVHKFPLLILIGGPWSTLKEIDPSIPQAGPRSIDDDGAGFSG